MSIAEAQQAAYFDSPNSEAHGDPQAPIWWQALYSRDQRFDGRFFIGAATTKIYCRPICPVPVAKPNSLVWFASATAAETAGYRPCGRCRPQASPGTPA